MLKAEGKKATRQQGNEGNTKLKGGGKYVEKLNAKSLGRWH